MALEVAFAGELVSTSPGSTPDGWKQSSPNELGRERELSRESCYW